MTAGHLLAAPDRIVTNLESILEEHQITNQKNWPKGSLKYSVSTGPVYSRTIAVKTWNNNRMQRRRRSGRF